MGNVTLGEILSLAEHLTVASLLLLAVVGSLRQWWVPGWLYRSVIDERDHNLSELFQVLGITDRATEALDRTTKTVLSSFQREDSSRLESRISRLEAQRNVRRRIDKTRENALDDGG